MQRLKDEDSRPMILVEYMEVLNSISPTFNASFDMVKTDGNASYTHDVYDFVTGELTSNRNYAIFSGTSK